MECSSALPLTLVALLASAPSLCPQRRVLVVDRNGGTGVFTEIQPAIRAANPGDRIEVRTSASYSPFVLDKSLDVEATASASVSRIDIAIPGTASARLRGFTIGAFSLQASPSLTVTNCQGPVLIDSVRVTSFTAVAVSIVNSSSVLLLSSFLSGGSGSSQSVSPGQAALLIQNGRVAVQASTLRGGGGGGAGLIYAGTPGGPALRATASEVFCSNSVLEGGPGGYGGNQANWPLPPGAGGDGGSVDRPALFMSGCVITGGRAGTGLYCSPVPNGFSVRTTSVLPSRVTADSTLGSPGSNVVVISSIPSLRTRVAAGMPSPIFVDAFGVPGTFLQLYLDGVHGYTPIPGIDGPFLLTPAAVPLFLLIVGASGLATVPLMVPPDPALRHEVFFLQGAALQPAAPLPSLTELGELRIR
jgi:hypothetical protein